MNSLHTLISAAALALTTVAPIAAVAESHTEEGARVFRRCVSCHAIGADAENKVGPHLNDIFGRVAGSIDGFRYSRNIVDAGINGLVWDAETLDAFLARPRDVVSGTKMRFNGLRSEEDRIALITYLQGLSEGDGMEAVAMEGGDPELSPEILAIEGDLAYGQYLASSCVTCHQAGDVDSNIPSIFGWPSETFVTVLHAYKNKDRDNNVMQQQAGTLSNEEIAALAAYFETLE